MQITLKLRITQPNKKTYFFFCLGFLNRLYIFGTCWFQICNRFFWIRSSFWDIQNLSFFMFWDILHAILVIFPIGIVGMLFSQCYILIIHIWMKWNSFKCTNAFHFSQKSADIAVFRIFFGKNGNFKYFEKWSQFEHLDNCIGFSGC